MTDRLRCVVLDDFQRVATSSADWSSLEHLVDVISVAEHPASEDELIEFIGDAEIVVTLRERINFPEVSLNDY